MEILGVKWALSSFLVSSWWTQSSTTSIFLSLYLDVCFPPYLFITLSTFELEHDPPVVLYLQQIKRSFGSVAITLLIIELLFNFNALSTKTSYFLIKHKRAKRMQPSSTEIVLTFSRKYSCCLLVASQYGIYDGTVLAKGEQYGQCLFVVALWYYNTVRPQRDIGHTGLA
jgi:hypothetical protein